MRVLMYYVFYVVRNVYIIDSMCHIMLMFVWFLLSRTLHVVCCLNAFRVNKTIFLFVFTEQLNKINIELNWIELNWLEQNFPQDLLW